MFESFYGLTFNPFSKDCDSKYLFKSNDYTQAISRLDYLKNTRGFALLTGEPGSGKTYTLKSYINSLNPNLFKIVYIPISTLTVLDFYKYLSDFIQLHKAKYHT